jgi:hypothetical protein
MPTLACMETQHFLSGAMEARCHLVINFSNSVDSSKLLLHGGRKDNRWDSNGRSSSNNLVSNQIKRCQLTNKQCNDNSSRYQRVKWCNKCSLIKSILIKHRGILSIMGYQQLVHRWNSIRPRSCLSTQARSYKSSRRKSRKMRWTSSIKDGLRMLKVGCRLELGKISMANKLSRRSLMMSQVSNPLEWTCLYLNKSKSKRCRPTTSSNSNKFKRWWFRCKSLSSGHSVTSKPKSKISKRKWTKRVKRRIGKEENLRRGLTTLAIMREQCWQISLQLLHFHLPASFSNLQKPKAWIAQMQCTAKMVPIVLKFLFARRMTRVVLLRNVITRRINAPLRRFVMRQANH